MKFIIVTGGVCSSLGKGIAAASIGTLLKNAGVSVFSQKLDPYLNHDPGTMSPFQHGEVFVTDDGAEADLDLGHYERFTDTNITKHSSVTSGKVYTDILQKERRGDFLGATIQIIPHVTSAIKESMKKGLTESGAEIAIIEIGGTVGDIEGQPFIEAARQLRLELGSENVMFVHLTLLPYLKSAGELKTKPTQSSVRELRSYGIQPTVVMLRSDYEIADELREKVSQFCDVALESVIPMESLDSVYEVPLKLNETEIVKIIADRFKMNIAKPKLEKWEKFTKDQKNTQEECVVGLVGKYVGLDDAYLSVIESIKFAAVANDKKVKIRWVDAEDIEKEGVDILQGLDAICVPGGFGQRGIEGKILAAKYARENDIPYLGLCLGMQIASIEFARNVAGIEGATSQEFDENAEHKIIHIMEHQKEVTEKGGSMRLGAFPCKIKEGTKAYISYGCSEISERHRHRFEFNNAYKKELEKGGLVFSGTSPDGSLVEMVEVKDHPFMIGVQFHPEFKSRPYRPHPLFRSFIKAIQR